MRKTVLLAGAGQLGSRYLQGLAKVSIPLDIYVFDISDHSLTTARNRWDEVDAITKDDHQLFFISDMKDLPRASDLTIVSTGAYQRAVIVSDITARCQTNYWVLEKVLAQNENELDAIATLTSRSSAAWVNTPRRAMKWYQEIKKHILPGALLQLNISGGQWGLACNSVHFLDLLQWFSGEKLVSVDTTQLPSNWIPSKRPGYYEVLGTTTAHFLGGSVAELCADNSENPLSVTLIQGEFRWEINERSGEARRSDGLEVKGHIEFQSSIAQTIVEDILTNAECKLPSMTESVDLHKPFLRDMLNHWNQSHDGQKTQLPIT